MKNNPENVTILLAEDAKTMRKIEISILKSLGYTNVIEAEDGQHAKKLLQQRKGITLIISDWNMPNMSGYEFLTWVRTKSKKFREIPFILATAQSDKEQVTLAEKAGVTAFVAKPFTAEDLQQKIEMALNPEENKKKISSSKIRRGKTGKTLLRVAHLQITDHLLLGLVKDKIQKGTVKPKNFDLETKLMGSWNPVAEALENNEVDAAFMLAPIAMDLFAHDVPLSTVLLAHRGGSIMVRNANGDFQSPFEDFFRNKSFLIPHKLSIHHMLGHMFFKEIGLKGSLEKGDDVDVNFEVAAPVTMPEFLKENDNMGGFIVAEPIGSKAVKMGSAKRQFMTNELWPGHPCCVVVMSQNFIQNCPDSTREFVRMLVDAGQGVNDDIKAVAKAGVKFLDPEKKLGLKEAFLEKVITDPQGIRWDNLYPDSSEFEIIREYMYRELGVLEKIDYKKFIDFQFADSVCKKTSRSIDVQFPLPAKVVEGLLHPGQDTHKDQVSLSQLLFEKGLPEATGVNNEGVKELSQSKVALQAENKLLQDKNSQLRETLAIFQAADEKLFKEGVSLLKEEQFFEAAGYFNAVLARSHDNLKALNNLAVIYYEMEMYDKAKSSLEKILSIDPGNKIAQGNLNNLP